MTVQTRADGFMGALQGIFSFGSRTSAQTSVTTAQTLYDTDGLAARIVDRPAEDALSRGVEVDGDQELQKGEGGIILNELDRLSAIQHLTDAVRWARLHGAGAVLMLTDDGASLEQPLNTDRLQRINDLLSYPATAINPEGAVRYSDPRRVNYGEPVYYRLTPRQGQAFVVHESRLLRISGDPVSYAPGAAHALPWMGRSALEAVAGPLKRYRDAMWLSRMILERKQQPVHKMKGMAETLERLPGAEGEQIITKRLSMVDLARGVLTTVAVDGDDEFTVLDASISGIDALLAAYRLDLCAADGTPVPILFGEGLSGLGNSGAGERGIYSARITGIRERSIRPALERLVSLIWAQAEVSVAEPEHWRVVFKPLFEPTEGEAAKAELDRANAQKARVEALETLSTGQYLLPEEGRAYVARAMPEYGVKEIAPLDTLPDDNEPPPEP